MSKPPRALTVTAPARLHLGFLDLNGGLGRRFGGIGLSLDRPVTRVTVARADTASFAAAKRPRAANPQANGPGADRADAVLESVCGKLGIARPYAVHVEEAIPAHAGLGSGTQLALAIGAALARLEGLEASPSMLGPIAERGARSAIGMAAFETGGLIVDGGRGPSTTAPPVLLRCDFPTDWRVILVLDRRAEGVSGDRETKAFAGLPQMRSETAGELCRLVLMRLLPGLKEHDIAEFGAALTAIQEIVGNHFAPAQNGSAWTSPNVGEAISWLGRHGAVGLGQSSWGPTGFAFFASEAAAQRHYSTLVDDCRRDGLIAMIVSGRNAGAEISTPPNAA